MKNKEGYVKFNINHHVLVKLKESGYQVLLDDHNSYSDIVRWKPKSIEDFKNEADKDGYTKFQMWQFMNLFGNFTDIGFEVRFDTNILIHKSEFTLLFKK